MSVPFLSVPLDLSRVIAPLSTGSVPRTSGVCPQKLDSERADHENGRPAQCLELTSRAKIYVKVYRCQATRKVAAALRELSVWQGVNAGRPVQSVKVGRRQAESDRPPPAEHACGNRASGVGKHERAAMMPASRSFANARLQTGKPREGPEIGSDQEA